MFSEERYDSFPANGLNASAQWFFQGMASIIAETSPAVSGFRMGSTTLRSSSGHRQSGRHQVEQAERRYLPRRSQSQFPIESYRASR